jgi:nucleotide-binding universal stress UspA family protein
MTNSTSTHETRFERVLLATDFSDASQAAYQAAIRLCRSLKASLYILHVTNQIFAPSETIAPGYETRPWVDSLQSDSQACLNKLILETALLGLKCSGGIAFGITHETIVSIANSEKIDLIVMGTRSIHGIERLVFGSTAEAVLLQANCPVFTVGPQAALEIAKEQKSVGIVLFATDFDASTSEALRVAEFFSHAMGTPLHCINILPRTFEDVTHEGVVSLLITQALQHLASNELRTEKQPVCAVAYGSEISNAVVNYSKTNDARLIVLGVRRSSLAASHVPAHIAYRIITEAICPVLTIAFPREEKTIDNWKPAVAFSENSPARLADPHPSESDLATS